MLDTILNFMKIEAAFIFVIKCVLFHEMHEKYCKIKKEHQRQFDNVLFLSAHYMGASVQLVEIVEVTE